jgi:urea transport system permease protein
MFRYLLICVAAAAPFVWGAEGQAVRARLVEAVLADEAGKQTEIVKGLAESNEPMAQQILTAWRGGSLYIFETNDVRTPVVLDAQQDSEGRSLAIKISDGEPFKDAAGTALRFSAEELTAADTDSKLRKTIKTTLDIFALSNPNPKMRRDAIVKLGQEQNAEYLPYLEPRLAKESVTEVQKALREAIAVTKLKSTDEAIRLESIRVLSEMRSINALASLQQLAADAKANKTTYGEATLTTAGKAVYDIEMYMWVGNLFGTAFRGLSLAAVLLVAALGLAITFGLMRIINMAHGEIMMIGAYSAYVTQNMFRSWFGTGVGLEFYFIAALLVSFISAGIAGLLLERGVIRFLYSRPLESLLATWGVSLILQQVFRHIFGAANVQVNSPAWLSGSFVVKDVLLAYNRLFVIAFAVFIVWLTYCLLTKTSLGLQIRAVMQNGSMASALGVRTDRVNMMTFAFGSGLAGMAGCCLSQIGNVGPSLGQNYIVDCFMVVVLGGVGNLVGTVSASLGIGVSDQILQPWLGAVLGKITVLAAIILFLQWRPAGLFVTRSRSLEG